MTKVSVEDFAKHRGIQGRSVRRYIAEGIIPPAAIIRERHRVFIDQAQADKYLNKHIVPRKNLLAAGKVDTAQAIEKAATSGLSFHEARTVKERFTAALRKLEYEEKSGKLVDAETVKLAAFNKARAVRDTLLNIPDRIAPILAAEADEAAVNKILATEIRSALEDLAK